MAIIDQVKALLGITDTTQDVTLTYLIDLVTQLAQDYTRLAALPPAVNTYMVDMVIDRYRMRGYGQTGLPQVVSSITEDRKQIQFRDTSPAPDVNYGISLSEQEKVQLRRYRVVWS